MLHQVRARLLAAPRDVAARAARTAPRLPMGQAALRPLQARQPRTLPEDARARHSLRDPVGGDKTLHRAGEGLQQRRDGGGVELWCPAAEGVQQLSLGVRVRVRVRVRGSSREARRLPRAGGGRERPECGGLRLPCAARRLLLSARRRLLPPLRRGPPTRLGAAAARARPPDIPPPRGRAHARRARRRSRPEPRSAGRAHSRRGGGVSGGPWQLRARRADGALARYPPSGAPAAMLARGEQCRARRCKVASGA